MTTTKKSKKYDTKVCILVLISSENDASHSEEMPKNLMQYYAFSQTQFDKKILRFTQDDELQSTSLLLVFLHSKFHNLCNQC